MAPVPGSERAVYLRRGLSVPHSEGCSSGPQAASAWPYEPRAPHKAWAREHGFFWIPCCLCGREFGGHEIVDTIPDPERGPGAGKSICPVCTAERNGGTP